jgi:hypothetical protein
MRGELSRLNQDSGRNGCSRTIVRHGRFRLPEHRQQEENSEQR